MSKSVTLGDGAINESGDRITIHLMTPADFPAGIQIRWPVAAPVRPRTVHRDRSSRHESASRRLTRHNQIKAGKLR